MRAASTIGAAVIGSGFIGTVHIEQLRRIGVSGFALERAADTVDRTISTEDVATILLRYGNGTRGIVPRWPSHSWSGCHTEMLVGEVAKSARNGGWVAVE